MTYIFVHLAYICIVVKSFGVSNIKLRHALNVSNMKAKTYISLSWTFYKTKECLNKYLK